MFAVILPHTFIADWAVHSKNIIIAYLHFVPPDFVTTFLIAWWNKLISQEDNRSFTLGKYFYIIGLTVIEFTLLFYAIGFFTSYLLPYRLLFIFSSILTVEILFFLIHFVKPIKIPASKTK